MGTRLETFCALEARNANIPMIGTAPRVDVWLLLEYPHPWGRRAFEESEILQEAKAYLAEQAAAIPNSRIQLIKHRSVKYAETISFHLVLSRELSPVRYRFQLPGYESLLDLDIRGIAAELPYFAEHATTEPLYLACTNGRRDACCAARGLPVYEKLSQMAGESAWQTSHLGGHRFAANLLCLPHGILYGRVDDADLELLVREYARGRIFVPSYRGRSCYPPEVQAAASFLRHQQNLLEVYRIRLDDVTGEGSDQWLVCFAELGGRLHRLRVGVKRAAYEAFASCGADHPETSDAYYLIDYQCE